ncbi:U32 family peptidase [Vallitalea pronyensis]|uniref:U32 family peptidase n=1 Tax=Vallitalea pronyensis TaxID=1348613 RepID=A0A8J8SH50_9FIRM|nr:U32 family peptidase [Vallitalea pronyensis]QUI23500.1 U32 family peptidase [Vallitalea pronyensis]
MKKKPEILAPAGSFDSLVAAVNGGCDAVYVGGKAFSARAYASNFDRDELFDAIDYCHLRGVKIYLTVNTVFKEKEIEPLMAYVHEMYQGGIDAVILQDFGAAMHIKKHFKGLDCHASTQMTIHQLRGVNFLKQQGFSRVVLNREATMEEVRYICQRTDMEIECFVHGALCYAYSGQCLMSSILGGRSGNRGRCAGTCRLPYSLLEDGQKITHNQGDYLLSPKDIATLDLIPEMMEAGIDSFKIEGRMKSPEYVAAVTSMYRKYVDMYAANKKRYKVEDQDRKMLLELYNRGGFSKGYYVDKKHQIMSMKKPNHQGVYIGNVKEVSEKDKTVKILVDEAVYKGDIVEIWTGKEPIPRMHVTHNTTNGYLTVKTSIKGIRPGQQVYRTRNQQTYDAIRHKVIRVPRKQKVYCEVEMVKGKPLKLMLSYQDIHISQEGAHVQQALKQSLTEERLRKQLQKTGEYPFVLDIAHIHMDHDGFLPISVINQVRRDALEALSHQITAGFKREAVTINPGVPLSIDKNKPLQPQVYTLIRDLKQYEAVKKYPIGGIYLESEFFDISTIKGMMNECHDKNMKVYLALPRIFDLKVEEEFKTFILELLALDVDGFLIRTYGEYELLENNHQDKIMDYNMNIFNSYTIKAWKDLGATRVTLSPELHHREIQELPSQSSELLLYGYLPLMVTKQCVVNNTTRNSKLCYNNKKYEIKDRYGKTFYVDRRCNQCMNVLYNSSPLILLDQMDKILHQNIKHLRMAFTTETQDHIMTLLGVTFDILNGKQMVTDEILNKLGIKAFNRGHFMRGIE